MKSEVSYRLRPFVPILSVIALFLSQRPASAQDPPVTWTALGPAGDYVKALTIDPNAQSTLYAGLVEDLYHPAWGVIKSTDGGMTWTLPYGGPLPDSGVLALAIDPSTAPSTVYAGLSGAKNNALTVGGGVFKSIDGGASWNQVSNGMSTDLSGVWALAIDPLTPSTLYAGSDKQGADLGKLYKTTNGGAQWVDTGFPATPDGLPQSVLSLAIAVNPVTLSETIYAGTDAGAVYVSTDAGTTWNPAGALGLPPYSAWGISVLVLDPSQPSTVYAGLVDPWDSTGAIFNSLDGGATWQEIDSDPLGQMGGKPVHTLAIDPRNTSTVYVGIFEVGAFVSSDGGQDWNSINSGLTDNSVHSIVIVPAAPTLIYAATCGSGLFEAQQPSSDSAGWLRFAEAARRLSAASGG